MTKEHLAKTGTYIIELNISVNSKMTELELRNFLSSCVNEYNGTEYHAIATVITTKEQYLKDIALL